MAQAQNITIFRGWRFTAEFPQFEADGKTVRNVSTSTFEFEIANGDDTWTPPLDSSAAVAGKIALVMPHTVTATLPPAGTSSVRWALTEILPSGAREIRAYGHVTIADPFA